MVCIIEKNTEYGRKIYCCFDRLNPSTVKLTYNYGVRLFSLSLFWMARMLLYSYL